MPDFALKWLSQSCMGVWKKVLASWPAVPFLEHCFCSSSQKRMKEGLAAPRALLLMAQPGFGNCPAVLFILTHSRLSPYSDGRQRQPLSPCCGRSEHLARRAGTSPAWSGGGSLGPILTAPLPLPDGKSQPYTDQPYSLTCSPVSLLVHSCPPNVLPPSHSCLYLIICLPIHAGQAPLSQPHAETVFYDGAPFV